MSKLLVVEGQPLKMHMDGDNPAQVLKITKLIFANGGVMKPNPDDETILLSQKWHCNTNQHPSYHINWLYDCIRENKMLNITRYLLVPPEDTAASSPGVHSDDGLYREPDTAPDYHSAESPAISSIFHQPESSNAVYSDDSNLPKVAYSPPPSDKDSAEASDVSLSFRLHAAGLCDSGDSDLDIIDGTNHHKYHLRPKTTSRNSRPSGYESDSSDINRKRKKEESPSDTHLSKKPLTKYSEEENQKMINYLIENNAIFWSNREITWRKAVAKGIFVNPSRSALSLRDQFRHHLRYNFQRYTSDPKALRSFEKYFAALATQYRRHNRYSESELYEMIQYLIKNDAISKAFGDSIWEKMEADKILVNPHRTAVALRTYFRRHLRHFYMNYTNEPKALREFQRLTEDKK